MLYGHGGDVYSLARELKKPVEDILDFSSNVSPLPLPREFIQYLMDRIHQIHLLPEVDSAGLREVIAERYGLGPEDIMVGSGTTQWIFALPRVSGFKKVVIPIPTYSDYEDAALRHGCRVEYSGPWPDADPEKNPALLDDVRRRAVPGSLVFLCNPNNPTGRFLPPAELYNIIRDTSDVLWVVDESYAQFTGPDDRTSLLSLAPLENLIVLRSFSKIYGIPGLRLGYAAGQALHGFFQSQGIPWAVGRLAQLAGEYFIRHPEIEEQVRRFVSSEKRRVFDVIRSISGLDPLESFTPFFLIRLPDSRISTDLCSVLKTEGILVRDCSNFKGLGQNFIRVGLRGQRDNDVLFERLKAVV